ncbi:hypothetical protein ABZ769_35375 [Streptomyces olivoreticuli]
MASNSSTASQDARRYVAQAIAESRRETPTEQQIATAEQILTDMITAAEAHGVPASELGYGTLLADDIIGILSKRA